MNPEERLAVAAANLTRLDDYAYELGAVLGYAKVGVARALGVSTSEVDRILKAEESEDPNHKLIDEVKSELEGNVIA